MNFLKFSERFNLQNAVVLVASKVFSWDIHITSNCNNGKGLIILTIGLLSICFMCSSIYALIIKMFCFNEETSLRGNNYKLAFCQKSK